MRPICAGCARPVSVCLCDVIPSPPFKLQTRLLVLQHPHELKHKLATVPVLSRCVQPCHVVVGRRLHSCNWPFTSPSLSSDDDGTTAGGPTLLLFPGLDATELQPWYEGVANGEPVEVVPSVEDASSQALKQPSNDTTHNEHNPTAASQIPAPSTTASSSPPITTLVILDGTWEHAQEMVKASLPFLAPFATQVCLPFDRHSDGQGMGGESDLILRKEPFGGCVSTMEAVAHALAVLEPDGRSVEMKLMEVLRKMVSLQASHFGAPKVRPKLTKKSPKVWRQVAGE